MKTAKIGLVVLSALHLCYSIGIGDVIVQEENFLGTYDEDPSVLDLSHLDVDKLISETDDEELYDIFHLVTKVIVSDISFKSLKKICQYNIFIDIVSQDNLLDCVDVKRERRLVKRENDDSEDDAVGSGDSDIDVQEDETSPVEPVSVLDSIDGSGDSEIEIQETTIAAEEQVDITPATEVVKEYGIAQASVNEGETAKETDLVDSVPNAEESKNASDTQPEVPPIDVSQPDVLPSETVNQPTEESVNVETDVSNTEAPSEAPPAPEPAQTVEETVVASSGDETATAIAEESVVTSTSATENTTPIPETVPNESETPIPTDQDAVADEIQKTTNENIPSILSRGADLIPVAIPIPPEETTTVTAKTTEPPAPKAESPRKLGDVDSIDSPKSDRDTPPQTNPSAGDATDSKQKENLQAGTVRKEADQTNQDQSPAKSGISGLNVFIFFVIAAAVAGAAVFGYKMYKNRQVSYSTVNTGEDFGKELQEVKVKRADDERNADGQNNFKEVKPLMFNDLDITEIEEQEPHTPQPTPRTFKVTPTDLDQNSGEGDESNTKKYDQQ